MKRIVVIGKARLYRGFAQINAGQESEVFG
jgi:hypothetical protein